MPTISTSSKTSPNFDYPRIVTRRDSDLEAFSHNPTDVASRHWSVDQAHEPYVRTCGSSRTKQDFYREDYELFYDGILTDILINTSPLIISRVKLTCLTTV